MEDIGGYVLFASAILAAGVIAGLLAGLLGVGGGIVIVPVLYYLFTLIDIDSAIKMHLAVGTSLATIVFTSATSTRAHWRRGAVDLALLRSWTPWIILGAFLGMVFFRGANTQTLTLIFAVVALIVAIYMVFRKEQSVDAVSRLPRGPVNYGIGIIIGSLSSVMGIGGGTLSVPILSLFHYPIRKAVGTAAAIGLLISIPGTLGAIISGFGQPSLPPFSFGYVNILALIILAPLTSSLAPFGARLSHSISQKYLRYAFSVFLLVTSVNMYLTAS